MKRLISLYLLLLAGITISVQARVYLGAPFTTAMVLQQNSNVNIWGTATPGATVNIQMSWSETPITCVAGNDRKWKTQIPTPAGSYTLHSLTFTDGSGFTTKLNSILIGEVWLASGQSNMEMPVSGWGSSPIINKDSLIESAAKYTGKLRMATIPEQGYAEPRDTTKVSWKTCNKNNVGAFGAVAYIFGCQLVDSLNVPVGIINASYGGSPIRSWLPRRSLEQMGEVINSSTYNTTMSQHLPSVSFNGLIHPLIGYNLAGFIWYQGENGADTENGVSTFYTLQFCTMVQNWRDLWGLGDLPFYSVELAPYIYNGLNEMNAAYRREQQNHTAHLMKNMRHIGINDQVLDNETEQIHPGNKVQVGRRLANCALHDVYKHNLNPANPELKSIRFANGKAYLKFTNMESGFNRTEGIKGFEIRGSNANFYEGVATVEGDEVVVSSSHVSNPKAVHYCFRNWKLGNLKNGFGLPIIPFRSEGTVINREFLNSKYVYDEGHENLQKAIDRSNLFKSRYRSGNQPGYIDATYYATYQEALERAKQLVSTDSDTETLSKEADNLNELYNRLYEHAVPITEGYYYIVSAYTSFSKTKALCSNTSNNLRWGDLNTEDANFAFKLEKTANGNWTVKNLGNQKYIGAAKNSGEVVTFTEQPEIEQIFKLIYNGHWNIINTQSDISYSAQGTEASSGNVITSGGSYNDPASWYLRPITDAATIDKLEKYSVIRDIKAEIDNCKNLITNTHVGTSIGDATEEAISTLREAVTDAEKYSTRSLSELTKSLADIQNASKNFVNSLKSFETNKWYYITNMDAAASSAFTGNALYSLTVNTDDCYRRSSSDIVGWGNYDAEKQVLKNDKEAALMWRIVPVEGQEGLYALQNRLSGNYLGVTLSGNRHGLSSKPQPYLVSILGHNQVELTSFDEENVDRLPLTAITTANAVSNQVGGFGSAGAWSLQPVDETLEYVEAKVPANCINIVCFPFAISNVSCASFPVKTYTLKNIPDKETIQLTEKNSFEAGEPFFLLIGNPNVDDDSETFIRLTAPEEFAISPKNMNGLIGVFNKEKIPGAGYLYFNNSHKLKTSTTLAIAINGQQGYIDPKAVSDTGEKVDLTLVGGIVEGIHSVVFNSSEKVKVYGIDGKLIRQDVDALNATHQLPKGVYLIGKKKILVD